VAVDGHRIASWAPDLANLVWDGSSKDAFGKSWYSTSGVLLLVHK
jgi:hypothetical protein